MYSYICECEVPFRYVTLTLEKAQNQCFPISTIASQLGTLLAVLLAAVNQLNMCFLAISELNFGKNLVCKI